MCIVTNHPAFCLNIPQKHRSSRYPALAPQIPTFWIALSARPAQSSAVCHCNKLQYTPPQDITHVHCDPPCSL